MKQREKLNREQQLLVEQHLALVHWVIINHIHINETVYGFGYDDLFQEGCIWLCKAATSYHAELAKFSTYAKKVIRNGLISYCRQMCNEQRSIVHMELDGYGELTANGTTLEQTNSLGDDISTLETIALLESVKKDYSGVTLLGIEALELKIRGSRVTDIAALYQVSPPNVGAWISRSVKKLRNNPDFMDSIT